MEASGQLKNDQPDNNPDNTAKANYPTPPKSITRKIFRGMFLYLLVPYLFIFGLLIFFQRSLIYPGSVESANLITGANFPKGQLHDVTLETEDNLKLNGWFVLPDGNSTENLNQAMKLTTEKHKVVIYFPGNAQNRKLRSGGIRDFTQLGFSVLLVDYRGYADNPGSPSQKWIKKDAMDQWNLLNDQYQIPAENIFIFGESLGGAVAVQTVSELCKNEIEPGGLFISSSFSSLADVASHHYPIFPIRLGLLDQWNSKKEISNITCPIFLLHGQSDQIVPIQFGKALFEAAPSHSSSGIKKHFKEILGGTHNAIPRQEIKNALNFLLNPDP